MFSRDINWEKVFIFKRQLGESEKRDGAMGGRLSVCHAAFASAPNHLRRDQGGKVTGREDHVDKLCSLPRGIQVSKKPPKVGSRG